MNTQTVSQPEPPSMAIASIFTHPGHRPYNDTDPFVRHIHDRALHAEKLRDTIADLAAGRIVAAHHHGLFGRNECAAAAAKAIRHEELCPYDGADNLDHLGDSLFETGHNAVIDRRYFDGAIASMRRTRELWEPGQYPLDLIRAVLDEGSERGANLLRIRGRVCPAGLVRVQENAEIAPHVDHAGRDRRDAIETQQIEVQLTGVLMLAESETGGDTTVWPVRLSLPQYNALRLPEPLAYGIDVTSLPQLKVTLKPRIGDLMLFDARYVHAVSRTCGTARVSLSFFVGLCRDGRIVVFS
jgi:hypothetical protein